MTPTAPFVPRMAWITLALALAQPLASALGFLGLGTPIGDMSSASTTGANPATYAFIIWSPIFLLSIVWAVRQVLPRLADDPTITRLRLPLAGAFLGNVVWMLLARFTGNGFHLALVLALILACALWAFLPEARLVPDGAFSRWVQRPFLGLLAGWVTAAFFVNVAGALKVSGLDPDPWISPMIILVAGGTAALVLRRAQGDPWYMLAAGWALVAVALAGFGIATVGMAGADGQAQPVHRLELASAIAAVLALGGVVATAFSIWRRGGMTA